MNQTLAQSQPSIRDVIVILTALALPSLITWIYFYRAASASAGMQQAIYMAVKIVQFGLPVAWVLFVQRVRMTYKPAHGQGIFIGLAFGALIAAAVAALYVIWLKDSALLKGATSEITAKVAKAGIDRVWKYAVLGVFYSLCHSFLEEYYWRWFVFGQLRRIIPLAPAIVVSSLGFMAHHVLVLGKYFGFDSPATWLFSGCVAIGGAVWAWLYDRTGSLLGPWLSHMLVDAAIFAVGYDLVRETLS
jgi:membrane protease YdiL (CAAX protease family)